MKLIVKTLQNLAMTYCHYIAMRMHFRAVVLARSVEDNKALLSTYPCLEKPSGQGCS